MNQPPDFVILAGGLGTRLRSEVEELPKSMAPILGQPFLAFQFKQLLKYDCQKVILSVGYKSELIKDYFGDNYEHIQIVYANESEPLGTGGAILNSIQYCDTESFYVLNGDSMFEIDYRLMKNQFDKHSADCVMGLKELEKFDRYGAVEINAKSEIIDFKEKQFYEKGYINAGCYLINKQSLESLEFKDKFSIERDFFEDHHKSMRFFATLSDGYFLDIGIPDDYKKAQVEFKRFLN